jgi:hypothetical protein
LSEYFSSRRVQKHLVKSRLIDPEGRVIDQNRLRQVESRVSKEVDRDTRLAIMARREREEAARREAIRREREAEEQERLRRVEALKYEERMRREERRAELEELMSKVSIGNRRRGGSRTGSRAGSRTGSRPASSASARSTKAKKALKCVHQSMAKTLDVILACRNISFDSDTEVGHGFQIIHNNSIASPGSV